MAAVINEGESETVCQNWLQFLHKIQRQSRAAGTVAVKEIETQQNASAENLIARSMSGLYGTDKELSNSTRRQLLFALRIAGYREFVRARGSFQVVADDIMETFDNPRTVETFRLIAEMSELG